MLSIFSEGTVICVTKSLSNLSSLQIAVNLDVDIFVEGEYMTIVVPLPVAAISELG